MDRDRIVLVTGAASGIGAIHARSSPPSATSRR